MTVGKIALGIMAFFVIKKIIFAKYVIFLQESTAFQSYYQLGVLYETQQSFHRVSVVL